MNKQIIKNFLYLVATKGIDFLVPVLLLPLVVNRLTLEGFGLLAFASAIGIYFSSVMQYGYNITAVREIARVRDDHAQLSQVYSQMLASSLLLCLACSAVYCLLFLLPSIRAESSLYLAVLFFIFCQSFYPAWFFQAIEKMYYLAIINSISKVCFIAAVWFWVETPDDVYLPPLLQGLSLLLGILLAFNQIKRQKLAQFNWPSWSSIMQSYRLGYSAFVTQLAPTLYSTSMTFILGLFASNYVVGLYSAAMRVIEIFNAFSFLLVNAVTPQLSRHIALHAKIKSIFWLAGVTLTLAAAFLAPFFAPYLFEQAPNDIAFLIQLASPMIVAVFVRMAYGPAFLMLTGHDRQYKNTVLGFSVAGFSLAWFVVAYWQTYGALSILVGTSVGMTLATWWLATKVNKKQHD